MYKSPSKEPELHQQRLAYDMTSFLEQNIPIIWITGVKGTGINFFGRKLASHFNFTFINVMHLIENEKDRDTDRGRIMNDCDLKNQTIPTGFIIDLIKEAILQTKDLSKGILITKFPQNRNQAKMFIKEIGNVQQILHLQAEMANIIDRVKDDYDPTTPVDVIKKHITKSDKLINSILRKYKSKISKVETNDEQPEVFQHLKNAIDQPNRVKETARKSNISESSLITNLKRKFKRTSKLQEDTDKSINRKKKIFRKKVSKTDTTGASKSEVNSNESLYKKKKVLLKKVNKVDTRRTSSELSNKTS